jgi:hypothetical protein
VPRNIYDDLRGRILSLDPAEAGLAPSPALPRVYGAVVDMGYPRATATLVGLADGTTSLYLSSGGGFIGAGEHEQVAAATRALLGVLERHLDDLPADTELPVPVHGRVVLRALTFGGQRAVDAAQGDLESGRHPLSTVYRAAHDVITQLRLIEESRGR